MKRLIAAEDVEKAKRLKENLYVDSNTIITPQAIDIAKELDIEIVYTDCSKNYEKNKVQRNYESCKEENNSNQMNKDEMEPALKPEQIYMLMSIALETGLIKEEDLEKIDLENL